MYFGRLGKTLKITQVHFVGVQLIFIVIIILSAQYVLDIL